MQRNGSVSVFAVSRAIFDHPAFAKEPFTEREAWLFLISEAAWRPTTIRVGSVQVDLKRGQCAHSIRFLADRWAWSKSRVDRFFGRLKIGTMIGTAAGQGVTVVTICNYDEYQKVGLPERDGNRDTERDSSGTAAGQIRNRETGKEDILSETGVSDAPAKKASKRSAYPPDFEAAWLAYPTDRLMSKKKAATAWARIGADERANVAAAIPAFVAHCRATPDYRPVHMVRFITEGRAEGFLQTVKPVSEDDWQKRLTWARSKSIWATGEWGPAPGQPGCLAPEHLLKPNDGTGWTEWSRRPQSEKEAA